MQLFNIRVLVYPELVEIKGTIPTQVLDKLTEEGPEIASIIYPPPSNSLPPGEGGPVFPSPSTGEGEGEGEGVCPMFSEQ